MNERTREDFLRLLRQSSPRQRSTTAGAIGGAASEDSVGYVREELAFVQPDLTTRSVTFYESRLCDCGRLLTAKNPLKGRCSETGCNRLQCDGCLGVCCRCRRTVCPAHYGQYGDGTIYCVRCRPFKLLKLFFDIKDHRSDE